MKARLKWLKAGFLTLSLLAPLPLRSASADQAFRAESPLRSDREGAMPTDPRYWAFHEWYVNHAVLGLVVSGTDYAHLADVLSDLKRMKDRGVIIGDVAIIGNSYDPSKGAAGLPKPVNPQLASRAELIKKLIEEIGLGAPSITAGEPIAKRLGVTYSPTWVVRHHGKTYVYEGLTSPARLFTAQGVFNGP